MSLKKFPAEAGRPKAGEVGLKGTKLEIKPMKKMKESAAMESAEPMAMQTPAEEAKAGEMAAHAPKPKKAPVKKGPAKSVDELRKIYKQKFGK